MTSKARIHIIAGPTASGKSAKALEIAAKENGIILNADSVQVYDGLPLLSAQPSEDDLAAAPHDLYGTYHPNDDCSAGNWREDVIEKINDALENGQTPIICGGSGLYIKALMEGFSPIPDIPDDIRQRVIKLQEELGNPGFYEELQKRDPVMAERLHPFHTARLVRAYEVLETTGKSLADFQDLPKEKPPAHWEFHVTLMMPERDDLYARCNERFLKMLEMGALDEVKDFTAQIESGNVKDNSLLCRALGYTRLRDYQAGILSKDDAIALSQQDTRQYAKRQITWFRNQLEPDDLVS